MLIMLIMLQMQTDAANEDLLYKGLFEQFEKAKSVEIGTFSLTYFSCHSLHQRFS